MKIFLQQAVFRNIAPFGDLTLNFEENDIAVLTAINGKGKTTILSYIVDAFHTIAKDGFLSNFPTPPNKYYRVSSNLDALQENLPAFVYFRFNAGDHYLDYLYMRVGHEQFNKLPLNKGTYTNYTKSILNPIKFDYFCDNFQKDGFNNIKITCFVENKTRHLPLNHNNNGISLSRNFYTQNIITYFPSYRYDSPIFLNTEYKNDIPFNITPHFNQNLPNPIEVTNSIEDIISWLLGLTMDSLMNSNDQLAKKLNALIQENSKSNYEKFSKILQLTIQERFNFSNTKHDYVESILKEILVSKKGNPKRIALNPRYSGPERIFIEGTEENTPILVSPSLFSLSAGELSLFTIFTEIIKQADKIEMPTIENITGIVLIDEVDKHLHIKLQKEVLPKLFGLFPNLQFIVTSHSPFLQMGLAEEVTTQQRTKIIDIDNGGLTRTPTEDPQYLDVYDMMIKENKNFKTAHDALQASITENNKPLIITEGKTDIQHLKTAMKRLNIADFTIDDFNWYDFSTLEHNTLGCGGLFKLLEQHGKTSRMNTIIGIFDRDQPDITKKIEKDAQPHKEFGNNVYGFCIPTPKGREQYTNISIESYYEDKEIKKEYQGKRLHFSNEIWTEMSEFDKKILDKDAGKRKDAFSKARFADLVENDIKGFSTDFNFDNFNAIFDIIIDIIKDATPTETTDEKEQNSQPETV